MHHGSGPQNVQHPLQRSRSFTGSEEEQPAQPNLSPSPAAPFAPSASPSAPQSPSYQIQQLMSRSPVTGQNVNITLQSVGPVVGGNQQITLAPLPLPSPTSPGFQFSAQQRRFEHGSPSYIQVTSPLSQQVQTQSPTQPSPGAGQALQSVRAGAPGPGLGICSSSPTGGFVDASVLVRQISLSPSSSGHFVFQEAPGLAPMAQGAQVQLQHAGTPIVARERRLSQPHAQSGGTIHHLGPQSPVAAGGTGLQPLATPGHITTASLPPQISSIIQGQLIQQQQQALQGQPLSRPLGFERAPGVLLPGVGGPSPFGMTSPPPPTSPSRTTMPLGLSSLPLTSVGSLGVKKVPKKLEEIPPASQEMAQMRKQCLDYHYKEMEVLREAFKEYLIELFFLQHLQGNMMDFLAFKKKHYAPLQAYLRQNDLDIEEEDEEEEEEEEKSEVINDEVKVVTGKDGQTGTPVAIATQLPPNVSAAFSSQQQPFQQQALVGSLVAGPGTAAEADPFRRQPAMPPAEQSKRPRLEVGHPGVVFQHPGVNTGVPLQQLMPTVQGGMPPTPQAAQLSGQKQSQQQYDPSTGPPVQNAASLHTPPPQLPARLPPASVPTVALPSSMQFSQQPQVGEAQAQLQIPGKTQQPHIPVPAAPPSQLPTPSAQPAQPALHTPVAGKAQLQVSQLPVQPQTVASARPPLDPAQPCQRPLPTPSSSSSLAPVSGAGPGPLPARSSPVSRPSASSKALSPVTSRSPGAAVPGPPKPQSPAQNVTTSQDTPQEKLAEQIALENQIHQRIADLRKEGLWSLRRLPKLQEAPRPKSHWDYLLEEMQWMATDFAQERRWKLAAAKKLVRTVARQHAEKQLREERGKREEQNRLRRIAASAAREIEHFWSNLEQVVEIKLQVELEEKRKKALNLQKVSRRGRESRSKGFDALSEHFLDSGLSGRKRKASTCLTDDEVEDEEETIEEEEAHEGIVDHHTELSNLAKEAELPLMDLVKLYEGAFLPGFQWTPPEPVKDESSGEEDVEDCLGDRETRRDLVLIDSLFIMDQFKAAERMSVGKPNTKDIAEVTAVAEAILPKGSSRVTTAVKFSTPSLLYGALRDYQKIGLDWLAKLYRKNLNGILADEAGLGKTVQIIAFFAHLACNEGNWGPHLVVVRSCNILKWELELKRWCPGLKTLAYVGSHRELKAKRQDWTEPNSFHICVTSYKHFFRGYAAFSRVRWRCLIVDEMQRVKGMAERHWEAVFSLQSQQRLLLLDMPLHNTFLELWTMVHFLIPGISRPYLSFPLKAPSDENQDYYHKVVIRLHRVTQPFILRRTKRDVEKQLTKKYEHVLKCRLSSRQKALYEDVILQPGTQEALKSGHFINVLSILMRLQRICNHPGLIEPRCPDSSYVAAALQYWSASLILKVLERDPWKETDLSIFDIIGLENKITRYEAELLSKKKVTRKLMEEIFASPPLAARPVAVKLKASRLFQPVQYGQKPEGRTVAFPSTHPPRTVTANASAAAPQGPVRGRPPIATFSANPDTKAAAAPFQTSQASTSAPRHQPASTSSTATGPAHPARLRAQTTAQALGAGLPPPLPQAPSLAAGQSAPPQRLVLTSQAQARLPSGEVVKIAQLASIAGPQSRVAQPETPVTLQFQGNKFTLSHSQLRQLTAGQPLQLQGSVLQIVSAPGQPYLRAPGPVVMQTVSQAGAVHGALGSKPPASGPTPAPLTPQVGVPGRVAVNTMAVGESGLASKPASPVGGPTQEEKTRLLKERLDQIHFVNERRCSQAPVYGRDLLRICSLPSRGKMPWLLSLNGSVGKGAGSASSCLSPWKSKGDLVLTLNQHQESLQDVLDRVACVIPPVVAAPPSLWVARPPAQYRHRLRALQQRLREHTAPYLRQLRQLTTLRLLQFPELRLVQFDSGKLEALAILLQKLKSEGRRVLILSQMVLMLDILEMFLNFHYLTYIRIDENANSEQRQELMRSFNRDRRIFCALLSTHSRATGINLVEADTVVFYDNDLNPVMDAKAQEWCDRIGRCKDIHIYRLVSGNSIEEKLLKNGTKDLIREVAAQGNDYSMAFLTQRTIQELFEVYSPMDDAGFPVKAEEFVVLSQEPSVSETIAPKIARPFIEALKSIECLEEDTQKGTEEAVTGPGTSLLCSDSEDSRHEEEPSQLEELADFMEQLTPIEKYALNYLELFHTTIEQEKERNSEDAVRASVREWESCNAQALQEKEAQLQREQEEADLLTYTREDAYNMEYIYEDTDGQTEVMPLWTPPTPPQDDNDIYIDSVMCLMYETMPIPEAKLPPVYVRKERKRHKTDPSAAGRKKKQRHGEAVVPPRSLFDRATPGMLKIRREGKEQKKNLLLKQQAPFAKPLPTYVKSSGDPPQDSPEWLIGEDWALLQAVKQLLELPLNLTIVSPAHTPNWDLVSDVVNSCSRIYRSSKQCRNRYENVIIPREEGKSKNNRPLRTSQIYAQDENATHTQLYTNHFDLMKMTAGKRSPPIKPLLGMNPFQKNPKHASVLAESGINYDKPLPPIQVASLRAERIAKEKKALADQQKAQQPAVAQPPPQQQQPPPPSQQPPPPLPQAQAAGSQPSTGQPTAPPQPQTQAQPQPVQAPPKGQPAITTVGSAAVLAGTIKTSVTGTSIPTGTVSGNVIVNTIAGVPAATFQSINKRLASPVAPGALTTSGGSAPTQVVHTQQRAVGSPATVTTDLVSMATTQGVRAVTSVTASAVVTTNLTPVQTPARSLVTQVSQATGVQLPGKTITPAHFQLLRQQQQQQQQPPPQQPSQVPVPQIQGQAQSPAQIKAVGKLPPEHIIKMQKQKMQLPPQPPAPPAQPGPPQPPAQVQVQPPPPPQQQSPQLTTVTAPRPGALLTGTTVANLQVARLTRVPASQLQAQGQMQTQTPQPAQVALAKPPVVSVPAAVVSSPGVTTLPMNVAGISVAIGQPQKAAGQTVVAQPVHVQQLLKLKQQAVQQQKAIQPQVTQGQAAVQQKLTSQQIAAQGPQQKVTYAAQPALKTQFLTTPISQAQKLAGTQQVQTQIQVAKLPQVVQQQTPVASIQQVASASQQATAAGPQVQMIPAVTATTQVVQQKLIPQQVVPTASAPLQAPGGPSPAQGPTSSESPGQQPKLQMRVPAVRLKTPTKPPCQ
ncbi:E1A-binding protein p400 isoform X4 [Heterocephalus glaber]|uniref:E1A-binding protein p400 isoform X4 n=1 Tax=Heterocephalus glaber TaxID=10181 RepID=A0AAX6SVM8_HETGA|nr:E1A-binding protein p400 isoform X4 [Heterocephalus glaber]